jgi:hypothetical protein
MILPMRGPALRSHFNRSCVILAGSAALGGLMIGLEWAGPVGGLFGMTAAFALAARLLGRGGFYRP